MARFVLKFHLRGRPNRNRPDRTAEKPRVVLGSRPLANAYVNDRLVAPEAVAFSYDGARLTLEVLDGFAGVFLDGRPVDGLGPLPEGAAVQVGHALVEATTDAAKGTCTLLVHEEYLPNTVEWFVRQEKVEPAFALEASGPQEHRWGASPVLRRANLGAAAAGVLLLGSFLALYDTDALSRGALAAPHRPGAGKDAPKGCAACHSPGSSDYAPRCAACHPGFDSPAFHPYRRVADTGCEACHAEHRGAEPGGLLPEVPLAKDAPWPGLCARCHEPLPQPPGRPSRDRAGAPVERPLLVDGFSHRDHRDPARPRHGGALPFAAKEGARVPVACAECHRPDGGATAPRARADFATVTYARCLDCHPDWRVPVHGRDEGGKGCLLCHEKPAAADGAIPAAIRKAVLPDTGSTWLLPQHPHSFGGKDCAGCHAVEGDRAARVWGGAPRIERVFRHDHHLRTVAPLPGTELDFSGQCLECHRTLAGSDTLAGTPLVDTSGCSACHGGGVPEPVPAPAGRTRAVNDVFHRVHTVDFSGGPGAPGPAGAFVRREQLRKGCLSCHVPAAGDGRMGLAPEAEDCKACHTRHENLGQGKCALCHLDRAHPGNLGRDGAVAAYRFNEEGIFDRAKAGTKREVPLKRFDHRSRGHAGQECAACHDPAKVDAAASVKAVPLPPADAPACLECHGRTRFHR